VDISRLKEKENHSSLTPSHSTQASNYLPILINTQVSGQAAASIRAKFTALFPETHPSFPSPTQVVATDLPTLRTAGLSQRKAEYIQGLAEKFASGEFTAEMLVSASDEDLIDKLVAVRGLGRWSVGMFSIFPCCNSH
jgi:DNA-3-methyladenine glycosylase II